MGEPQYFPLEGIRHKYTFFHIAPTKKRPKELYCLSAG